MRTFRALAVCLLLAPAVPLTAQIARTFVSITGNDANNCSNVLTPCRTFSGGIAQVDYGGEVIVLTTGSYAGGTIDKSVTINVPSGIVAFTAQPIVINALGAIVSLRGMTLTAIPGADTGINNLASGMLIIDSCTLDGWTYAIRQQSNGALVVRDTTILNSSGVGVYVSDPTLAPVVNVENCRFVNNATALWTVDGSTVTVRHSVSVGGNFGFVNTALTGPASSLVVEDCMVSKATTGGVRSNGAFAVVSVGNSTVVNNNVGFEGLGTFYTFGTNQLHGNNADYSGTVTPLGKS